MSGHKNCGCTIVDEKRLAHLMGKYLGLVPGDLTGVEREILLWGAMRMRMEGWSNR